MKVTFTLRAAMLGTAAVFLAAADIPSGPSNMPSMTSRNYDPAADYQKGVEALKAGRYDEAKSSFQRAYSAASNDPNMNLMLGVSYMGLRDYKGARKYLERAVRLDPKLIVAHEQLGVAYAKLGDRPKAEAEIASLKQLQAACGSSCADAQALDKAISSISGAIAQPQASAGGSGDLFFASARAGDSFYLEAVSLIHERRYQDALGSLAKARVVFGAHPDILTYLGFANRKLGHYDLAENYYRQALAAAPNHRQATEYYGELMVERGNIQGAKALLGKLDRVCTFGCAEADELRQWIKDGRDPSS